MLVNELQEVVRQKLELWHSGGGAATFGLYFSHTYLQVLQKSSYCLLHRWLIDVKVVAHESTVGELLARGRGFLLLEAHELRALELRVRGPPTFDVYS